MEMFAIGSWDEELLRILINNDLNYIEIFKLDSNKRVYSPNLCTNNGCWSMAIPIMTFW